MDWESVHVALSWVPVVMLVHMVLGGGPATTVILGACVFMCAAQQRKEFRRLNPGLNRDHVAGIPGAFGVALPMLAALLASRRAHDEQVYDQVGWHPPLIMYFASSLLQHNKWERHARMLACIVSQLCFATLRAILGHSPCAPAQLWVATLLATGPRRITTPNAVHLAVFDATQQAVFGFYLGIATTHGYT